MIQETFLNGFLITFFEKFLQGFGNILFTFSLIEKSFQEIFLKPFRNISGNDTEIFLKGFLIFFCGIFLQDFEN